MAFNNKFIYVVDDQDSCLYRSDLKGSSVSKEARLACYDQNPGGFGYSGLVFDKKGRLFISQRSPGSVFEISPNTGEVVRTIVTGIPGASHLAADPLNGDLFLSHDHGGISRLDDIDSKAPRQEPYAIVDEEVEGLAFSSSGNLYSASKEALYKVRFSTRRRQQPMKAKRIVLGLGDASGIAIAHDGESVIVSHMSGQVTNVDVKHKRKLPLLTAGNLGFSGSCVIIGFNDCLYVNRDGKIVKLVKKDGTCGVSREIIFSSSFVFCSSWLISAPCSLSFPLHPHSTASIHRLTYLFTFVPKLTCLPCGLMIFFCLLSRTIVLAYVILSWRLQMDRPDLVSVLTCFPNPVACPLMNLFCSADGSRKIP